VELASSALDQSPSPCSSSGFNELESKCVCIVGDDGVTCFRETLLGASGRVFLDSGSAVHVSGISGGVMNDSMPLLRNVIGTVRLVKASPASTSAGGILGLGPN
jgi:hypothetical protein